MAEEDNDPAHSCDAISRLPDELLHTILDKLPLNDAVSTGFLSHRWRHLWKYVSTAEFGPSWVQLTGKEIVSSLNQFICLHKGLKIQSFSVRFTYQPEMSKTVDSWVLFAINKHVENLDLDFDEDDANIAKNTAVDPCYKLHTCVFNSKSLTILLLCFCDLELPVSFQLQALKVLHLHRIELHHDIIQKVTSNAPVLQQLFLSDCNRTTDLHVHVAPNQHVCNLVIIENFFPVDHSTTMFIKAPTALNVGFMGSMPRSNYRIDEVSEYTEVYFSLHGMFDACGKHGINILFNDSNVQKYENILQELLASFQKADTINLCDWCIQLLSLRELRNLKRLRFNCTTLEISSSFWKWELPGIIYMLKACHEVEELTLVLAPRNEEIKIPEDYLFQHDFQERRFLHTQDLRLELENLSTLRFKVTHGDYQTWKDEYFDLNKFFNGAILAIEFMQLLRGHAVNLGSLIFSTNKQEIEILFKEEEEEEVEEEEKDAAAPPPPPPTTTKTRKPPIQIHLD